MKSIIKNKPGIAMAVSACALLSGFALTSVLVGDSHQAQADDGIDTMLNEDIAYIDRMLDGALTPAKNSIEPAAMGDEIVMTNSNRALVASALIDARVNSMHGEEVGEVANLVMNDAYEVFELVIDLEPFNDVPDKDVAVAFESDMLTRLDGELQVLANHDKSGLTYISEYTGAAENQTSARSMIGQAVLTESPDADIELRDLILNEDGVVEYTILSSGGFAGIGNKLFAVAIDDIIMMEDGSLYTPLTKSGVESLISFHYDMAS